jgi:hypothetical protein
MSNTTTEKPVGQITLLGWILSYPHLKDSHLPPGGTNKRFGAEFRLPKDHPNYEAELKKVQAEITRIKKDKEKGKVKIFSADICLKDGDTWEKAKDDQKGHMILSANRPDSQGRPKLVTRKKVDVPEADIVATFYPGCVVNAIVGIYHTSKGGGHKIPASLETVQFSTDGARLGGGGGTASLDDLPDLEDDESDGLDEEEDDGLGS